MSRGLAREPTARRRGALGEGDREVVEGDATPSRQRDEEQVAEESAERGAERRGQPADEGGEPPQDRCRRRSRMIAMRIGTTESTMTTPTTMWMRSWIPGIV